MGRSQSGFMSDVEPDPGRCVRWFGVNRDLYGLQLYPALAAQLAAGSNCTRATVVCSNCPCNGRFPNQSRPCHSFTQSRGLLALGYSVYCAVVSLRGCSLRLIFSIRSVMGRPIGICAIAASACPKHGTRAGRSMDHCGCHNLRQSPWPYLCATLRNWGCRALACGGTSIH